MCLQSCNLDLEARRGPDSDIQAKVEDTLRKSNALEKFYNRPITSEQLQREMERMAAQTKQPEMLRELWAALDNDPSVIAEVLARPMLVDRLLRDWYSIDERVHGQLRSKAESQVKIHHTLNEMRQLGGDYVEVEWVKRIDDSALSSTTNQIALTDSEWNQTVAPLINLPVGEITPIQEDQKRLFVMAVLNKGHDWIKIAMVEWKKLRFETWWKDQSSQVSAQTEYLFSQYQLPEILATSCAENSWDPMRSIPSARGRSVWTGSEIIVWGKLFTQFSGGRYSPVTDSWHPISGVNEPSPRSGATAVWTGTEMIVWGGWGGSYMDNIFNTGGRYNPVSDSWLPTITGLNVPSKRQSHTAVWTGQEMIIWGGLGVGIQLNSGARYNPVSDSWIPTSLVNAPLERAGHLAVWTSNEMIVWGGVNGFTYNFLVTGSRYNPVSDSWIATNTTGAPVARNNATAIWTGSEMIIWGGRDPYGFVFMNSGARYKPSTNQWTPTASANAPFGRYSHSAVWTNTEMIVWGGCFDESCAMLLNDGGRYNPSSNSWKPMSLIGAPSARFANTAVFTGNQMIIWGGVTGANFASTNTGARYNPSTDQWLATSLTGAPSNRFVHSAIWTGSHMVIWGGTNATNVFNNGALYNPASNSWTPVTTTGAPAARRQHTAIWTGSEMVLWGGCSDASCNGVLFSGGHYNPVTNSWKATALKSAPSNRSNHTAVWTGTQMLVWGGWINGSATMLNSGARYCISGTSDFSVSGNPTSLSVTQGGNGNVSTTVTSFNGFNSGVTLSCAGNPAGVTCGFAVNPLTPPANGSSVTNLTLNVSAITLPGTYNFQVKGISSTLIHTFDLQLTVLSTPQAVLTSLTLNPTSMIGTYPSQGTVLLSNPAPAGGVVVALTSSNSVLASVPTSVTIPAGSTSKTFTVTTSTPSISTPVTIFASYNGVTKSAVLTVTTDMVAIQIARYRKPNKTLTVQATSTSPNATTLRVYKTSTGVYIGTLLSIGNGTYSGNFPWPQNPQNIKVQSILGGSATKVVTTK